MITFDEMKSRAETLAASVNQSAQAHNSLVGQYHEAMGILEYMKQKALEVAKEIEHELNPVTDAPNATTEDAAKSDAANPTAETVVE